MTTSTKTTTAALSYRDISSPLVPPLLQLLVELLLWRQRDIHFSLGAIRQHHHRLPELNAETIVNHHRLIQHNTTFVQDNSHTATTIAAAAGNTGSATTDAAAVITAVHTITTTSTTMTVLMSSTVATAAMLPLTNIEKSTLLFVCDYC